MWQSRGEGQGRHDTKAEQLHSSFWWYILFNTNVTMNFAYSHIVVIYRDPTRIIRKLVREDHTAQLILHCFSNSASAKLHINQIMSQSAQRQPSLCTLHRLIKNYKELQRHRGSYWLNRKEQLLIMCYSYTACFVNIYIATEKAFMNSQHAITFND